MPKGKTDIKRFQKQEKRRLRNRSVRSAVKTYVGRARQSVVSATSREDETLQATVLRAIRELDRAARKGIIHPNNAARRKSRLMKRVNALPATVAAESPPEPQEQPTPAAARPRRTARRSAAPGPDAAPAPRS
jgi:small subunit ribosomal protein S20